MRTNYAAGNAKYSKAGLLVQESYEEVDLVSPAPGIVQQTDTVVPLDVGLIDPLLYKLLTTVTPRHSEKLLHPIFDKYNPTIDTLGNVIISIGKVKKDYYTAFSSHLDTVHREINRNTPLELCITKNSNKYKAGMVYARMPGHNGWIPSVLGADDKIGVWLMLNMIEKQIPGLYIFHVGEECGGIGSGYIARQTPDVLKGIRKIIAFDRAGYGDVIAKQRGGETASTEFTNELAKALNEVIQLQIYKGDVVGVFTDTANYTKLVSECTNLSVGYFQQHGIYEHFDLPWVNILVDILPNVKWEELKSYRDKTKVETVGYTGNYYAASGYGYYQGATNLPTLLEIARCYDPSKYKNITKYEMIRQISWKSTALVVQQVMELMEAYDSLRKSNDALLLQVREKDKSPSTILNELADDLVDFHAELIDLIDNNDDKEILQPALYLELFNVLNKLDEASTLHVSLFLDIRDVLDKGLKFFNMSKEADGLFRGAKDLITNRLKVYAHKN